MAEWVPEPRRSGTSLGAKIQNLCYRLNSEIVCATAKDIHLKIFDSHCIIKETNTSTSTPRLCPLPECVQQAGFYYLLFLPKLSKKAICSFSEEQKKRVLSQTWTQFTAVCLQQSFSTLHPEPWFITEKLSIKKWEIEIWAEMYIGHCLVLGMKREEPGVGFNVKSMLTGGSLKSLEGNSARTIQNLRTEPNPRAGNSTQKCTQRFTSVRTKVVYKRKKLQRF